MTQQCAAGAKQSATPSSFFFTLSLLFILSRLFFLLSKGTSLIASDEYYQGYIAQEILRGIRSSLFNYQVDAYTGGSIAAGSVSALFFSLFGPNLLSLKLTALLFSFITFFYSILFLSEYAGKRTALLGALLFMFPTPFFLKLSLITFGSHPESTAFAAAALYYYHQSLHRSKDCLSFFACGIFLGIGLWFSGLMFFFVLALLCDFLISQIKRRKLIYLSFGIILGLSPWFYYNASHGWSGLHFIQSLVPNPILFSTASNINLSGLVKGVHSAAGLLSQSIGFTAPHFLNSLYLLLLLYLYLTATVFNCKRSTLRTFFILFPIFFISAVSYHKAHFSWSGANDCIRYRYFPLLHFVLFIGSASAFNIKKLRSAALIFLVLTGLIFQFRLVTFSSPGQLLKMPGYIIEDSNRLWQHAALSANVDRISNVKANSLKALWASTAYWSSRSKEELAADLRLVPKHLRFYYLSKLGEFIGSQPENQPILQYFTALVSSQEQNAIYYGYFKTYNWNSFLAQTNKDTLLNQWSESVQKEALFSLGRALSSFNVVHQRFDPPQEEWILWIKNLKSNQVKWLSRGAGAAALADLGNLDYISSALTRDNNQNLFWRSHLEDFLWGVGWDVRERDDRSDFVWFSKELNQLPENYRQAVIEGYKAFDAENRAKNSQ